MIPLISKILRIPNRFVGPKIGIGRRVSDSGHAVMPLQQVGIKDFLALEIPARGMLLSPVLPEKSLGMIYAPRGLGKSWLGLLYWRGCRQWWLSSEVGSADLLAVCLWLTEKCPWPTFRRD